MRSGLRCRGPRVREKVYLYRQRHLRQEGHLGQVAHRRTRLFFEVALNFDVGKRFLKGEAEGHVDQIVLGQPDCVAVAGEHASIVPNRRLASTVPSPRLPCLR